ncbi:MAG: glycosyltransferase [Chthoniobacteraceae bacterium]|nr:glycosyltransferase [Chthoniobacteraceae bacterium]
MELTSLNPLNANAGHRSTPTRTDDLRESDEAYPIVVHSHLHWDWVWQRPQQFLSRISNRHSVLFVQEPIAVEGLAAPRARIREAEGLPNLTVLTLEFPPALIAAREACDDAQYRLVRETLTGPLGRKFARPVQWFYDPMAVVPFAGKMEERAVVYDCMDQLSQFRGAPPELIRRERELLNLADVVFAGGPKIHKAKCLINTNCHCYGCGVDVKHFGRAAVASTSIPDDLSALPGPRLGYFGVVDERMDYELVAALADAHPEWSVVIIGPWTKVDPATFPQRANLHWFGGRDYQQLPNYVKGFDVCLMPFAINEATEFINPTKALEYMAAARPIVSTAIEDVVLQFSDVVHVAHNRDGFIQACKEAVQRPDQQRIARGRELASCNSWEEIVDRLEGHIEDALETRRQLEIFAA